MFHDRTEAGSRLADALRAMCLEGELLVLALPRGGVPVAAPIARALNAPLDVFIVRKLGTPGQPELAMGAIASGGVRVMNDDVVDALQIPAAQVQAVICAEQREIARRESSYRQGRPALDIEGRTVILVDDGVATGATMRAAAIAIRARAPVRLIIAVPHGARNSCQRLRAVADDVLCLETPEPYIAVGNWYHHFPQTSDAEVTRILAMHRRAVAETANSID